jgi:hypothetical protein
VTNANLQTMHDIDLMVMLSQLVDTPTENLRSWVVIYNQKNEGYGEVISLIDSKIELEGTTPFVRYLSSQLNKLTPACLTIFHTHTHTHNIV